MTQFKEETVNALIERFRARLRLHNWEVDWYWQNDKDAPLYGSVSAVDNRDRATIELSITIPSFAELRRTIAHEIAHLFLWRQLVAVDALEQCCDDNAWAYFRQIYKDAHERDVDALAKIICELCNDDDLDS